ncbi:PGN_0703 family putative restriction endonuclease [Granulicella sibirica]|nr:hypothetical protein [Granulicella sibirica]
MMPDIPDDFEGSDRFHLDDGSVGWTAPELVRQAGPRKSGQGSATLLRLELNALALRYAAKRSLLHDTTTGGSPCVVFGPEGTASGPRHGNFIDEAYRAILADVAWSARLEKAHTAHRRAWPRTDWRWRELDAATSSDALLMNVFCFPGVLDGAAGLGLRVLLGIGAGVRSEFGFKPRIPLTNGRFDRTEIDLRLGSLLVEAKLTESDFQQARPALVERYRDLLEAFEPEIVAGKTSVVGYQLIRGTLAAMAVPSGSFCVLADARRPDLLEQWYSVMSRVRTGELRCRLQMLTWQEVCAVLPVRLQEFLGEKYGILPA